MICGSTCPYVQQPAKSSSEVSETHRQVLAGQPVMEEITFLKNGRVRIRTLAV